MVTSDGEIFLKSNVKNCITLLNFNCIRVTVISFDKFIFFSILLVCKVVKIYEGNTWSGSHRRALQTSVVYITTIADIHLFHSHIHVQHFKN